MVYFSSPGHDNKYHQRAIMNAKRKFTAGSFMSNSKGSSDNVIIDTIEPKFIARMDYPEESFDSNEDSLRDIEQHDVSKLNHMQKRIYDYVIRNPNEIVTIQAAPGTGKTFTLKAIAYGCERPTSVVIYKHDLLMKFQYCSRRLTVAKLFMKMLSMNYFSYKAFVNQICGRMSAQEFIHCLITLLHRAQPPPFRDGFVMIDEYTVIQKPMLVILLIILKSYRIGTIISGDYNQLQSLQSTSTKSITSFEIAKMFSSRVFSLDVNERCNDPKYNVVINYVSKFSTSMKLDSAGYALSAALFLNKLATRSDYDDLHIAGTHRELTRLVHMYVVNENIPVEFYEIQPPDKSQASKNKIVVEEDEDPSAHAVVDEADSSLLLPNGMWRPSIVVDYIKSKDPKKFLPYLPLKIGSEYYVSSLSESSIATLIAYDAVAKTVTMRYPDQNTVCLTKCGNDSVMIEMHRDAVMRKRRGSVYNFPIYPTNAMSMHRVQGCTVERPLDINLSNTTYQGMYVAISRVTHPSGIKRIIIPDMLSYALSTIINFPEHADPNFNDFSEELLDSRMQNYQFYKISNPKIFTPLLSNFFNSDKTEVRAEIRNELVVLAGLCAQRLLSLPEQPDRHDLMAINRFLADFEVYTRAALIEHEQDRAIWLHEYMLSHIDYSNLLQDPTCTNNNSLSAYCNPAAVYPFSKSTVNYILEHSQLQDTLTGQQNPLRLFKSNDCYYTVCLTKFQKYMYRMLAGTGETGDDEGEDSLQPRVDKITTKWLVSVLPAKVTFVSAKAPSKRIKRERPNV